MQDTLSDYRKRAATVKIFLKGGCVTLLLMHPTKGWHCGRAGTMAGPVRYEYVVDITLVAECLEQFLAVLG
ncbi:MAG: hypothetical protein HC772_15320 [Leptolyngbyaceae cyanobacterium CRU_2_3]|nr:hypothetical protein [Leptolyngbyaceae cyanobacterium CRU_2_3]